VNGAPFQVGLGRLLRKAKPDRLLIEPSGLGHPAQLLKQLRQAPWQEVLSVQPCVVVLDAQALAAGKPLPPAQQAALASAGLLVLNKDEGLDAGQRRAIERQLPECPLYWTRQAQLPLDQLPGLNAQASAAVDKVEVPEGLAHMPAIWGDPTQPICLSQAQEGGWSVGWRWHPSQQFDTRRLHQWLTSLEWRRAKLVIHSAEGWVSTNAVDNSELTWQASEWRRDSRIELIFSEPQDVAALQVALNACRH